MKLLIKLNFENDNNLFDILDEFYKNIIKEDIYILINVNDNIIIDEDKLKNYNNLIYRKSSINSTIGFINSNISDIDWDILLTSENIFKPTKKGFDNFIIKNSVKDIMWWMDNNKDSEIFSIKREYYDKFGYIFNPVYKSFKYALKEFKSISSKLKNSMSMIYDPIFEFYEFNYDEFIYNRREKYNFTLIDNIKIKKKKENKNTLNKFVDNVYCLNLEKRTDRWEHMKEELSKNDIKYQRFYGVDGTKLDDKDITMRNKSKGAQGCLISHRNILRDAIDNDYDRICIFQDDITFCKDFKSRFKYFSHNVPKDWDIMYLGCHFHSCPEPEYIKKHIYKNHCNYGCFAMILNKKIIKKIYDYTKDMKKPTDTYISELCPKYNFYSFMPFFVKTIETVSDISKSDDPFSYDVVNKHYSDYLFNIENIDNDIKNITKPKIIEHINNENNMLEKYLKQNINFVIYKNNRIIFDSKNNKQNIKAYDNYFTIYGKKFDYRGIRIKTKI